MAEKPITVDIKARWAPEQPDPQFVNQFAVQALPTAEIILTFGVMTPLFAGTGEEQLAQMHELQKTGAKVETAARLVMPHSIARQLHTILGKHLGDMS